MRFLCIPLMNRGATRSCTNADKNKYVNISNISLIQNGINKSYNTEQFQPWPYKANRYGSAFSLWSIFLGGGGV